MSYFQIVDYPMLYPGRCYFCGNPNHEPMLDTGQDEQTPVFPGAPIGSRIYMCMGCLHDLAKATSMVTATEADELRTAAVTAHTDADRVLTLIGGLADAVDELAGRASDHLRGIADFDSSAGDDPVEEPVPDEAGVSGSDDRSAAISRELQRPSLRAAKAGSSSSAA